MKQRLGMRSLLIFGAVAGALVAGAGVAIATGQVIGADNTINACTKAPGGDLRAVAAGEACRSNELPLAWSIQGPPGPQGSSGPAHVVTRIGSDVDVPATGPTNRLARVQCQSGETAVGGGSRVFAPDTDRNGEYFTFTVTSLPLNAAGEFAAAGETPTGWFVAVTNHSADVFPPNGVPSRVRAYALCAS